MCGFDPLILMYGLFVVFVFLELGLGIMWGVIGDSRSKSERDSRANGTNDMAQRVNHIDGFIH